MTFLWWTGWVWNAGMAVFALDVFREKTCGLKPLDRGHHSGPGDMACLFFAPVILLLGLYLTPLNVYYLACHGIQNLKGVLSMKKKLIGMLVYGVFCAYVPEMFTSAKNWYFAPPAPPSAEALKLIRSLEDVDGWYLTKKSDEKRPFLKKGDVEVKTDTLWASVYVDGSYCNGNYSVSDLRAIDSAATICMRRLTAKALDRDINSVRRSSN